MYKEHEVDWTDEAIARFWNFISNHKAFDDSWFAKQVGDGLIKLVSKYIKLGGDVLDYGMGKGYLIDKLITRKGINIFGCDSSISSVDFVNSKYIKCNNFKGCFKVADLPTPFPPIKFTTVFMIEVIEHLNDDSLLSIINEIKRILTKEGVVVITTPNQENLDAQKIICPECGGVFHKVQHLRCFSQQQLQKLLGKHGFIKIYCEAVNLTNYNKNIVLKTIRNIRHWKNNYRPHLIYIGRKS